MDDPKLAPSHGDRELLHSLYAEQGGVRGIFSSKVGDYATSRPSYPDGLYEALRDLGALPGVPSVVADLGAGTGLFSRGLLVRGHHVFAVELNAAMRAAADALLHGYEGYRGIAGSAEATTLDDGSVDFVTVAQAFHWLAIDATRTECLRILRPGGKVALIWNDRVLTDPLQIALESVFTEFGGKAREAVTTRETQAGVPLFFGGAPTSVIDLPHEQVLDHDGLQSLAFSRSYMPPRDSEAGRRAAQRIDAINRTYASTRSVTLRYRTVATVGRPRAPR